jgi:hypothetical protein
MAFRIDKEVERGEFSNEERGVVTGTLWLKGRSEPIQVRLKGNPYRDIAGCRLKIRNKRPAIGAATKNLHAEQNGVIGDMTASRKVREPSVPEDELLDLVERRAPVPWRLANALSLEWYSEANGRVVLESTDYILEVEAPAWSMTPQEEVTQKAENQREFSRYLIQLGGVLAPDDDDSSPTLEEDDMLSEDSSDFKDEWLEQMDLSLPPTAEGAGVSADEDEEEEDEKEYTLDQLDPNSPHYDELQAVLAAFEGEEDVMDEFEWEHELREEDRCAEAYQEAFEKYCDHPDRERLIGEAMGWELIDQIVPIDMGNLFEEDADDNDEDDEREGDEDDDEDDYFEDEALDLNTHHPLSQEVMDFALALQREAEEYGLIGRSTEVRETPILNVILHIMSLGSKLAGALDFYAQGLDPEPGFVIAMLKRAQVPLNEALAAFECLDQRHLPAETKSWLATRKRDLFELRGQILDLMKELRSAG